MLMISHVPRMVTSEWRECMWHVARTSKSPAAAPPNFLVLSPVGKEMYKFDAVRNTHAHKMAGPLFFQ